ncbi:MAG: protein-tyrosine-phosphatase [Cyclobacteriaceae bacterium]|jgi:arsenate reductase|nr:protein-tyrosine-phosphatase [Cyclobacteriaceae bacterium]
MHNLLLPSLQKKVEQLVQQFDAIDEERHQPLLSMTNYIQSKINKQQAIQLNFICTHNSRRSHISQLWAQAAAHYYQIPNVFCFSGGTEATSFNPRAVLAMQNAGFAIEASNKTNNPIYDVKFANDAMALQVFSKKYDDAVNPVNSFAAVMTCSHADENCPFIPGAEKRFALTYDDPKAFDDTSLEKEKYKERVEQIGREILFIFSNIKK